MIVAVLGLGSIGMRHARNLAARGARVRGYDPEPKRCAELLSLGQQTADSRSAALEGARAAVIATPNAQHLDDLAAAIGAGCHVLVEKPLAHTDEGVETILGEANARGLTVFVGHSLRFHPAVRAGQKLTADGALGEPLWARLHFSSYLPEWRPRSNHRQGYAADRETGGVLFDLTHEFDLANALLGAARTVAAVARCTGTLGIDSDDCADVILEHDRGLYSNLHLDYVTRPRRREAEVAGTEGILAIDLDRRRLTLTDVRGERVKEERFGDDYAADYEAEIGGFVACIEGRANPPCDGLEGLAVLRQVLAARRMSGLPTA